jgi:subtilisin family serine protease
VRFLLIALMAFAAACSGGGDASGILGEPQQLLVMLEEPEEDDEVEDLREDFDGVSIERLGGSGIFVLTLPAGTDMNEVLDRMDDDLRVLVSERDYTAQSPEGDPADQPIFGDEVFASIGTQPGLGPLGLPAAHGVSTGAGAVVAVVDTGVDPAHPALLGRLAPGGFDFIGQDADPREERNFLDDDGDGIADEQYGHGTFVASLVLAVAPDAMILPVRALDDEGFGTSSTVAAGIIWAADAGADVINVSADLPAGPRIVQEAIKYARQRDAVVVAAAGNGGLSDIAFPARFSDVVGVTAVDALGRRPAFANVGDAVSVVAPGTALLGALPFDRAGAGTATWSGTSFATPIVAGTAALVRAAFPALAREDVRRRLEDTAQSVDAVNPGLSGMLGRGLVQPAAALQ